MSKSSCDHSQSDFIISRPTGAASRPINGIDDANLPGQLALLVR
jgi:hypothetical protein